MEKLKELLKRHEGFRDKPYQDTRGVLTIGYGRSLETNGITEVEGRFLLMGDITRCVRALQGSLPFFDSLDPVRQDTLICMCFNLGLHGLLNFKKMLKACEARDWEGASSEMMNSQWASQVKSRATELALMMRTGTYLP